MAGEKKREPGNPKMWEKEDKNRGRMGERKKRSSIQITFERKVREGHSGRTQGEVSKTGRSF